MAHYQLTVESHFACHIVPGSIHCGFDDHPLKDFRYAVFIEADRLDDFGFVVDNMDVVNYFIRQVEISESCEKLCNRASTELWRPNFTRIEVRVWGTDFAYVSCVKTRGPDGSCV